jgi:hypothetical protein
MASLHPATAAVSACLQGRQAEALSAFAEDAYYCSLEYGPEDPRTSLGYYNLNKVCVGGRCRLLLTVMRQLRLYGTRQAYLG